MMRKIVIRENLPIPNNERKKILLVGCGKMGGSLLNGWLTQKAYDRISVVEPTKLLKENVESKITPVTHGIPRRPVQSFSRRISRGR